MTFTLHRRTRKLAFDSRGRQYWSPLENIVEVSAESLAIIVCDMWDHHWCRGASERVEEMAPRLNAVLATADAKATIILGE